MRISNNNWLLNKPIAHRGLWNRNIPENSVLAYKNAIDNGYPIEIDLYLTTDNVLVCFHDETLTRMTGVNKKIYDCSFDEIKELHLNGSQYLIPTFDEVLSLCENKTPLLIEIKNQPNSLVVDKTVERLKKYQGEFAVQSFNPLYIKKVKKLAPNFIRGILGTQERENLSLLKHVIVKKMLLNFLIKPDFISYNKTAYPLKKRKTRKKTLLAWTVLSQEEMNECKKHVDNFIFENFIPNE